MKIDQLLHGKDHNHDVEDQIADEIDRLLHEDEIERLLDEQDFGGEYQLLEDQIADEIDSLLHETNDD